jgi:hypothetical protein
LELPRNESPRRIAAAIACGVARDSQYSDLDYLLPEMVDLDRASGETAPLLRPPAVAAPQAKESEDHGGVDNAQTQQDHPDDEQQMVMTHAPDQHIHDSDRTRTQGHQRVNAERQRCLAELATQPPKVRLPSRGHIADPHRSATDLPTGLIPALRRRRRDDRSPTQDEPRPRVVVRGRERFLLAGYRWKR